MSSGERTTLDEIVTGLAVADGPAFRGDLARVLDRDSETIRQAIDAGLADDTLHLTGNNRVALTDPPTDEELEAAIAADELSQLQRRWMRVHRFRSWAQEQVTKASRTGVGVVFTDEIHILPNAALCRLVDDWTSPEAWFTELLGRKRTPEPGTCAVCGEGEILGDSLVEMEAPNGHEKTFAITFYGHCHQTETAEAAGDPPLLFAVRLRKERMTETSAHPVLSGSTSDTGLDLAVSFPDHDETPAGAPGMHTLDNILVSAENLRRRLKRMTELVGAEKAVSTDLETEFEDLTSAAGALRDDVQYTRDITRLTSTVRALRSIFESNWTFRDVGGRAVAALGAVTDVDQIALLMYAGDNEFEVIGHLDDDQALPDTLTADDSKLLKRVYQTGERVGLTDASDNLAGDPLAIGRTLLGLPIEHGGSPVGLLVVGDAEPGALTQIDHQFLSAVANPIGEALHSLDSGTPFTGKSGIDEVTGVFNQTRFFDNAAREFIQARANGRDLSALVFAIDDWDRISQEQNASATDEILRTVVERASEALRGSDFVGRYAQATFTALLIDVDLEIARKVADRIRSAIADEPVEVAGTDLAVTVSVGAAVMTPNVRSADRLVSLADSAMMKAADQGGDTVVLAATPSTPNPDPAQ